MAEGIVTFIGAVLIAGLLGPGAAVDVAPAVALGYVLLHELGNRALLVAARRTRAAGGKRFSTRRAVFTQLLGFAAVCSFGWGGWIVARTGASFPPAPEFLTLAPWLLVHVRWLAARRRIEREMGAREWPARAYLWFHVRLLAIPAMPFLMLSLLEGWALRSPVAGRWFEAFPTAGFGLVIVLAMVIFSIAPFVVRFALGTRTMPDGPLRRRLERISQRAGFRFLDIRVCDTHGNVPNAAFVGLLGRVRYVIMTDALLERLEEDDLVGVFAHEMGHSMRRHLLLYVAMFIGFAALLQVIAVQILEPTAAPGSQFELLLPLFAFPLFILMVFSPAARAFEIEADVYAGEVLRDPAPIARSLSKLGFSDPEKRRRGGLIHPSIETRVAFLDRYFSEPEVARVFRDRMRTLRRGIVIFAAIPVLLLCLTLPTEIREGRLDLAVDHAVREDDEQAARAVLGRVETLIAAGELRDDGYEIRMLLWQTIATARQDAGDFAAAAVHVESMRVARPDATGVLAPYNVAIIGAQQEGATGNWPALARDLAVAEREIQPIIDAYVLPDDDPQLVRERGDMAVLRSVVNILVEVEALPLVRRSDPVVEVPEGPERVLLEAVRAGLVSGVLPPLTGLVPDAEEALTGWRLALFSRLWRAVSKRLDRGPSDDRADEH